MMGGGKLVCPVPLINYTMSRARLTIWLLKLIPVLQDKIFNEAVQFYE